MTYDMIGAAALIIVIAFAICAFAEDKSDAGWAGHGKDEEK